MSRLNALLLFVLIFAAIQANGQIQDVHVVMETTIKDFDGSHWSVEFGKTKLENLADNLVGQIPGRHNILPTDKEKVRFYVMVPKEMEAADRTLFVKRLKESLNQDQNEKLEVTTVEVDIDKIEKDQKLIIDEMKGLVTDADQPQAKAEFSAIKAKLNQRVLLIRQWGREFIEFTKRLRDYRSWPLEHKYMFYGSLLGAAKSLGSVGYWIGATGFNALGIAQAMMSVSLDFVFSIWGQKIEAWKGSHSIPELNVRGLKEITNPFRRFYNDHVFVKAFIVNNLIGVSAGAYFRWLSWWADSSGKIQPPWSTEFLNNMAAGISVGGLAGAAGTQGNRTLRRKGYYGSGVENAINQASGLSMMIGGFLNGSGSSELFMAYLWSESVAKAVLYGASVMLPNKGRRVFVFHPEISSDEIKDLKFRLGVYDATDVNQKGFSEMYQERSNSVSWVDKIKTGLGSANSCQNLFAPQQ